jgi:hypothetical protein
MRRGERRAFIFGEGHRVGLARTALVEIARVGVVKGVLALPPAVGGEERRKPSG